MRQRTWSLPAVHPSQRRRAHARPWLLIEDASPVLQVSDLSLYHQAGFNVAVCSGPDRFHACPLVDGMPCKLVDVADIVLFGLDLEKEEGQRVLRAHLRQRPGAPTVIEVPHGSDAPLPDDATSATVLRTPSVSGQTRALWKALHAAGWRGSHTQTPIDHVNRSMR